MSDLDWWLALLGGLITLFSAASAAAASAYGAFRSARNGRDLKVVHQQLDGRLDAAIAAADRAGYLRGRAEGLPGTPGLP